MILSNDCILNIKYFVIIIIYSYLFFINHIYIYTDNKQLIEIDNEFNSDTFEKEIIYQKKSKLKPIAIYYPEYNNISYFKYFNKSFDSNNLSSIEIELLIRAQVNLAKNHQIYGFVIDYNLASENTNETMNIFLNKILFPFLIMWRNNEIKDGDGGKIKRFFDNIKKYIVSENYIKIRNKPTLALKSLNSIKNRKSFVSSIRTIAQEIIGEIFLIYPFKGKLTEESKFNEFDGTYDFSRLDLFKEVRSNPNILYYSGYIYKNQIINKLNITFTLFRTCFINNNQFDDYTPEKFYIENKIIFNWVKKNYFKNERFIFINSWNDYKNGNYLEYDKKYGYASLNSFSKSIFNISFQKNEYILNFRDKTMVAIHIHAYYEDLLSTIIKRLNKMPTKYDLYISTISKDKKDSIEKCLQKSNANKYEIKIYENKGRDVYPFISQMKSHYKNYKYICHLHTKKSAHKANLGSNWSEYLYNNLIGNKKTMLDILYDFEQYDKLGFVFPESYYEIINGYSKFHNLNFFLHTKNKNNINFLLKKIFHKFKAGDKLVFPVGNMFWAKTESIYQIFNIRLKFPKELGQTNETIMHAIERIWLYLVKLNGYYYKTTVKYY